MFSPNNEYLVTDNGIDQIAVYETDNWEKIATIIPEGSFKANAINYTGSVGFSSDSQYFGHVENTSNFGVFLNLQDSVRFGVNCDSSKWVIKGVLIARCYDELNTTFEITLEPTRLNSSFIGQVDYYFSQDGLSLLATHPYEFEKADVNEVVNVPLKYSAQLKEICLKRKNGEIITCIIPPSEGFPLDNAGNEHICFEKAFGCFYLSPSGKPF